MKARLASSPSVDQPGQLAGAGDLAGLPQLDRPPVAEGVEQVPGVEAGLDPLGQVDLGGGVEQRRLADLVQVEADQVGGADLEVEGVAGLRRLAGRLVSGEGLLGHRLPFLAPARKAGRTRGNDRAARRIPDVRRGAPG